LAQVIRILDFCIERNRSKRNLFHREDAPYIRAYAHPTLAQPLVNVGADEEGERKSHVFKFSASIPLRTLAPGGEMGF
jgi:hypothetical protein